MQEKKINENRVKVSIMGNEYTLLSDDSKEYILKLAGDIDKRIHSLANSDIKMNTVMATTLACLDYYDELLKERDISSNLRTQVQNYIKELGAERDKREKLEKELHKIKNTSDVDQIRELFKKNMDSVAQDKKPKNKKPKKATRINTVVPSEEENDNKENNFYQRYFEDKEL